eukprot:scaffold4437_cov391-Prasinococcus_capsulatus_cf.AAC.15
MSRWGVEGYSHCHATSLSASIKRDTAPVELTRGRGIRIGKRRRGGELHSRQPARHTPPACGRSPWEFHILPRSMLIRMQLAYR